MEEGLVLGNVLGWYEGNIVGAIVVGRRDGMIEGNTLGSFEGMTEGATLGIFEGVLLGEVKVGTLLVVDGNRVGNRDDLQSIGTLLY